MANLLLSVDYSIRRPAVTIFDGFQHVLSISFYREHIGCDGLELLAYPADWNSNEHRFMQVARMLADRLPDEITHAVFEGYAYSGRGRSFHLAEAAAFFKCLLMQKYDGIHIESIQPSTAKKVATGSGKAGKEDMISAWAEQMPHHAEFLAGLLKTENPANDIADSYWIGVAYQSSRSSAASS